MKKTWLYRKRLYFSVSLDQGSSMKFHFSFGGVSLGCAPSIAFALFLFLPILIYHFFFSVYFVMSTVLRSNYFITKELCGYGCFKHYVLLNFRDIYCSTTDLPDSIGSILDLTTFCL